MGSTILRDVTLRDGLQLTGKVLPTERKIETVRELLRLGVPAIELGSMARPDLVPTMANTLDVVQALTPEELEKCWIWVATPGHVAKAAAAGARNFQYCLSASDSHNKANIGRTTEESLAALPQAVEYAKAVNGQIQLCIATSFTCPFEGTVPEERVLSIANDPRAEGTTDIVLCDTLGQAIPAQVSGLIARVRDESPARRIVYHGHDTWGLGVANTLAAIQAGAAMVDGALGGLGGCPFAPGASGNTSSEDILFATRPGWLTTGNLRGARGPLREAARRTGRTQPLQGGTGRPFQGRGLRLGHPVRQHCCRHTLHHWRQVGMGNSFLVTTAIPDPGCSCCPTPAASPCCPSPRTTRTLAALCASGEYDVVLTQLRDVVDAPLLAGRPREGRVQLRRRVQQHRRRRRHPARHPGGQHPRAC